jgi:hypothetical protein
MKRPAEIAMDYPTRRQTVALVAALPALFCGAAARADALPKIVVTKDPNCGCCAGWVEHLRAAGFTAEVVDSARVNALKARLGIPAALASCHTAEIGRYAIEGHVPAGAIKRLLAERPDAKGLAVPGMPIGSPGMEVEGSPPDTYEVLLFGAFGQRSFGRFQGATEIRS